MNKIKLIIIIIGAISVIVYLGMGYVFRPISQEEAKEAIEKRVDKFTQKHKLDHTILRLYSDQMSFDEVFESGKLDDVSGVKRYHSASVGKTFTTTLMYKLVEEELLTINDPIVNYLEREVLEDLFVIEGVDYRDQVTIKMLLNHTSGAGDYFEDPVTKGKTIIEQMVDNPDTEFTPMGLIDFTRQYQKAMFKPGQGFHYSDTGYILAGMVIEKATGRLFHEVLHEKIIDPLEMAHTNLTFVSKAKEGSDDMLPIYINGVDFSHKRALSVDWSGGGLTTTTGDLLRFYKALNRGEIISQASLDEMKDFSNDYDKGIEYGVGMMNFNLEGLSPMLKGMPNLYGGVGATASYMLYDETHDMYIIMNVGSYDMVEKSVAEIVQILMIYSRIDPEK